ncbi:MAG: hypothetical protein F4164_10690 [Gemmatimonadales bacterium]|nr:hypothetical protein [Gemmatimonadales bacterium]MYG49811.1 hypothetical protein [Gemmatimonadales bacterium]MYK02427.1 hypothetical protein [Candidatus Palauibacter ramosifaciens]
MESCKHIDEWTLNRYADGELSGPSAAAVRQHLRSCAICRREVRLIRELSAALRALPTPNPPDGLFEEIYPQEAGSAAAIPFPVAQAQSIAFSRRLVLSGAAFLIAGIAAVLVLTLGPERAMAGASTLRFHYEEPGALTLRYETVSPLAAEPGVRARLRYWVPDSLRFAQTEPGYRVVELSREEPGVFSGAVALPPATVYAVAAVEHLDGNYIDRDFGRSWEYLKTDAEGRATLDARLYQVLAIADLSPTRAVEVTGQALSEYPERPELWAALLLYGRGAPLEDTGETPPGAHRERLERMDAAARLSDPGPGEMHALSLYARLLGREDIESHWQTELSATHPRHEYASQARLESILRSPTSRAEKLEALDRSWRLAAMPSVAQVGLQLSQESADPARTRTWLDRYAAEPVLRDLRLDVEVAERMMDTPALRTIAEEWILELLNGSADWLGAARPLRQTRTNFDVEAAESRARLLLLLGRLRLARDDRAAAAEAFENAARLSWQPEVLVELAGFHAEAGSAHRASELLALVRTDPVIPLAPHRPAGEAHVPVPTEDRLEDARAAWREHLASLLLDEPITRTAMLQTATGEETRFREVTGSEVTVVIQSLRPGYIPGESLDLLRANAENLEPAGVRVLPVAVTPDPATEPEAIVDGGIDSIPPFHYDKRFELWDALGAWREVQYSVLGRDGHLKYRGEDITAALRVALMLGDELALSKN